MLRTIALSLILFLAIAAPLCAQTQNGTDTDSIGTIIEAEGAATVTHGGQKNPAAADMPVYLNDAVETGDNSKIHILFVDDTELTLGDNADLTIDEYVFDPDAANGNKGQFSILRGAFLFASGLITKNSNPDVAIKTVYGSIGLRGTTVWGGDLDDEYGVFVQDGKVELQNDKSKIMIGPGQGTSFRDRNAVPSEVRPWAADRIERAKKKVALARPDLIRQRIAQRKQMNVEFRKVRREIMKNHREKTQQLRGNPKEGINRDLPAREKIQQRRVIRRRDKR